MLGLGIHRGKNGIRYMRCGKKGQMLLVETIFTLGAREFPLLGGIGIHWQFTRRAEVYDSKENTNHAVRGCAKVSEIVRMWHAVTK